MQGVCLAVMGILLPVVWTMPHQPGVDGKGLLNF